MGSLLFRPIPLVLASALLVAGFGSALGAEPLPSPPSRWVTDQAGLLGAESQRRLDAQLAAFQRKTGYQVVVWIGESSGGIPLEDWAARTFASWKLGRAGKDDGVALFVLTRDRRARIEVGYGLEAQLPDARASRIIREILVPGMKAGQAGSAILLSAQQIMQTIAPGQVPSLGTGDQPRGRRAPSVGSLILAGLVGLVFLIILVTNPSLALLMLFSIFGGRRDGGGWSGGGWSGGGGFSGGGGRSGGGGASGSW